MKNYQPLLILCLGYFMVIIDVTVVNVAIPVIAKDMHIGLTNLEWIVDAYTLSFAALLLSVGSLFDKYGSKKIFKTGLTIFTITSFLCGIATNFQFLIISRLLQGFGAALLVPSSISLINLSYPDKSELTKAIGVWAAIAGIAAACGPIIGAIITTIFNWRGIFFINIPFGIICYLLTNKRIMETNISIQKLKFDFIGQFLGIISIATLTYALIEVTKLYLFFIAGFIFIISFISFIVIEYFSTSPMLPLKLFKSPNFTASISVGFLLNLGVYGELFLLPTYFQHIKSYSVLLSGLAISPQMIVLALSSYLSGKSMNYLGEKKVMAVGLVIGSIGFAGLFFATKYTLNYVFFIVPLLMIGFGAAFTMPAATVSSIKSVPTNKTGLASAILNTTRQVGSLVGVALFGTIVLISTSFDLGIQYASICASGIFISGVILVRL